MLDPLTALGLTGNLIQIISFASNLVTEGNKLYSDASGASADNKTIEDVTADLQGLSEDLKQTQNSWQATNAQSALGSDDLLLRNLCEKCLEIAVELRLHLEKLRAKDGKQKRLRSYKQALILVWRRDAVEELAGRLEKYRQEINTRILFGLRYSLQDANLRDTAQFQVLDRRTLDILDAIQDGGSLDSKMMTQTDMLWSIASGQDEARQLLLSVVSNTTKTPSPKLEPPSDQALANASSPGMLLCDASSMGDAASVRRIMRDFPVDINYKDTEGLTPLHRAANADVAKLLLRDEHIKRNREDKQGRSALHAAVIGRRLDVLHVLLEAGLDKHWVDDHGKTTMNYASDCPAAGFMLRYGHGVEIRAQDRLENTGLMEMAWLGDLEGTTFYLSIGADVNSRNLNNETALTEASRHGDLDIVKLLLKRKADVSLQDQHRNSPLSLAVDNGRVAVLRLLLLQGPEAVSPHSSLNKCLSRVCRRKRYDEARILVEAGADINTRGQQEVTPLISAARDGDMAFVRWAVEQGARVNDRDPNGYSALALASRHNHLSCVRQLIDLGSDVNLEGHNGRTSLLEAAECGRSEIVRSLLEAGADTEAKTKSGLTALIAATSNGHVKCMQYLINHGVSLEAENTPGSYGFKGAAPLIIAVRHQRTEAVRLLASRGTSVNAREDTMTLALHHAAERGLTEIVTVLLDHGADVNAPNHWDQTPLHSAAKQDDAGTVSLLLERGADPSRRDGRGRTPWIVAKHRGKDDNLAAVLGPQAISTSQEEDDAL